MVEAQPVEVSATLTLLNPETTIYSTAKYSRPYLVPREEGGVAGGRYWFDTEAADRVVRFFQTQLTHEKGKLRGKPFKLDEWEVRILRDIFGWKLIDPATGEKLNQRRFRKVFLFLPKKNGKSLLASGVALYMLLCDREPGPEIYSCANDKKQAGLVFNVAAAMARRAPQIRRRVKITDSQKVMACHGNGGTYVTLSAEAFTKDGLNPSCLIYDEIHAAPNRDLYDTIASAMVSRDQPLQFIITTGGEYRPESVGYELYEYSRGVLNGSIPDESFYPVIYEAPPDADIYDEDLWRFVNPGFGVSVSLKTFQDMAVACRAKPSNINEFKRKHLNIWTNAAEAWIKDPNLWPGCKRDWDPKDLIGKTCYIGMDFAYRLDITAIALVFPMGNAVRDIRCKPPDHYVDPVTGDFACECRGQDFRIEMRYFIPEETAADKIKTDNVRYDLWKNLGWVKYTPGDVVDDDFIIAQIKKDCKEFGVKQARRDPWGSPNINTQLEKDAGTQNKVVEHHQGYRSMSGPMRDMEGLMKQRRLHHRGDPVLNWMVSNTVARMDEAGNIKPDKKRSTCRIDGVVALIMALAAALSDQQEDYDKHYKETGGIFG